jgi:predicted RNA-binding protein with RPS1 domain
MEANAVAPAGHAEISGLADIQRKMHLIGTVVKTTLAGAVIDVGLETPGVVHISQLQKEPVNRVEDVLQLGQEVDVWVRRVEPKKGRLELTLIEPLALEWREIEKGMVVKGKVTRIEKFGIFVEIGAERPGLVHISELTHDYIRDPKEIVKEGEEVDVKILDVNRRKKQIKLSMKAIEERPAPVEKPAPKRREKTKTEEEPAEKEEPTPTAMEMALREAMQRSNVQFSRGKAQDKRKRSGSNAELDHILSRTLNHQVKNQ